MTLSEMRRLIDVHGLQLTKSLGQNFLHDGNLLRRIVASAHIGPQDHILEIGPGLGPLTELLINTGAPVLAVEKDARLHAILQESFQDQPRLELVLADALDWLKREPRDWTGWKLVANLPYSVGSPILVELALAANPPECLVVTLQWEVIQRLAAQPDTSEYGVLTALVGLQFTPGGSFRIARDCFYPPPDVDSACATLVRRTAPLLPADHIPTYLRIIKTAFSQRRKMLKKLLKAEWPEDLLTQGLESVGIAATARAETVGIESWAALTRILHPKSTNGPSRH